MKKHTIYSGLFFLATCLLVTACNNETANNQQEVDKSVTTTETISLLPPQEFVNLHNQIMDAILIDVRTPQEYEQGALEGAINRDYHGADFENWLNAIDRKNAVFIYCQSGGRSSKTNAMLKDMGFERVYEMEGGYLAWEASQKKME